MTGRIFEIWGEQKYRKLLGEELRAKKKKKSFLARETEENKNTVKSYILEFSHVLLKPPKNTCTLDRNVHYIEFSLV